MNYTDRVAKGAAELDEILPGWERRIDLEQLRLESDCHCVLGQLSVDVLSNSKNPLHEDSPYERMIDLLCPQDVWEYEDQIAWEVERGYVVEGIWSSHQQKAGWTDLTEAWKRLIRQRLEA